MYETINTISILFPLSEILLMIFRISKEEETEVKQDKNSMRVLWLVIGCSVFTALFMANKFPRTEPMLTLQWAGVGIFVIGALIRWLAIYQLGSAFTVDVSVSKMHHIKQNGLYGLVRHPSYLGLMIEFLGFSLIFNSWLPLFIINIPFFIALLYRMRVEEQLLSEYFGIEYREYMKRHKRLIPFVY